MFDLKGKYALITGASGAIGGAIASVFPQQGATVALTGTRVELLEQKAATLGSRCHVIPCNLATASAANSLISQAEEVMGQIDILINNAGLTRDGLMMRMKDEEWQQVLDVNLSAAFYLSRAALRGMLKRRWGRMVNITSIVGVTGNPGQTNYAASKAGMMGMAKSLAAEVANRNITVNCIAPGFIASAMTEELTEDQRDKILAKIPENRMGTPEGIGYAGLYLASEEAAYVTGQTLHVNGGMAMI
ncbi:MAG: 3-oxoacyl-[acyl-carrier-protein] reductase [Alphaproteobacteria bacterium]|nr:3-oxoacyl-[acyl-carrier-protein] reductase [Alphaproteobacteria bacterium]